MAKSPLTSVFTRFRERLHGLAAGIVKDDSEADDILHDVFCRLWAAHPDIENESSAFRISYTAVRNSAIDSLRRKRSHPIVPVDIIADSTQAGSFNVEEIEKRDMCRLLLSASRKILKENHYKIFIMHDVDNLSYDEISRRLELSPENVRTILSRARKTIREFYRKNL